ncbi:MULTISPECIES: hypothetical protein [Saccharothrix]|uniref:hypothetical protein n=1 Tax=Saccharothrix TaxID=2071 RepID=UPI00093CA8EF|nr:hypothetical protein [Saccharothrix sp. CB00851]
MTWDSGTRPWIRGLADETPVLCYFCGEQTAIVSMEDRLDDTGRVELYCRNTDCDARDITVLVMRDGTRETAQRADVRVLRMIDDPSRPGRLPARRRGVPSGEVSVEIDPFGDEVVGRRRSPGPIDGVDEVGAGAPDA